MDTFVPSESAAKWHRPRSMPTSSAVSGSGSASASTTNEAKYGPRRSLMTLTVAGEHVHLLVRSPTAAVSNLVSSKGAEHSQIRR
ncbi:hypothetical protein F4561_004808 [Lipingzhangella halophila]|uniref:Uncharacterized protein n=1 Tax=Lipingzhangella halophila TaxID=1783352 RepID=A0A7W7W4V2_9ACTN|nr:hypothetical protein [Lipingzhangella halophila]